MTFCEGGSGSGPVVSFGYQQHVISYVYLSGK